MSEIRPQAETATTQRQRLIWKPALALLIVGAAISGVYTYHTPPHPHARHVFQIFLGLLAGYAGMNGIATGVSLNALIVLPFVVTGSATEEESPNMYAVSIIIFFIVGFALVSHGLWRIVHG